MKHNTLSLRRPKYGGITLAVSLGLLLLLGGCVSTYGQSDNVVVTGSEGASEERSTFASLFGGLFDAMTGWKESTNKDSTESSSEGSPAKEGAEELPNKTSPAEYVDSLSLIELEAMKAQALKDQRQGIECVNCVSDGEGNLLPAALVHSIKMQKTKTHVDQSQAKKNEASDRKEEDAGSSHNHKNHDVMSYDEEDSSDSSTEEKSKLNFHDAIRTQRRQLSKSKNRVIAPRLPLPGNCRCEYPSENIYTIANQQINQFRDGVLILPKNSIYCVNVAFICDIRDRPDNSIEWTCPNLNPPIIGNIGKSKGKNNNVIIGNPLNGFRRKLDGQSLSGDESRKLSGSESRKLGGSESRKLSGASHRNLSKSKVRGSENV